MIDLPKSTFFGKRIPKQKFYENLSVSPEMKRYFVEQISTIIWMNKIAPDTVNITAGKNVAELEVFEIRLNQPSLNKDVLQLIDRGVPYHILFILTYEGKEQAWIGYKEAAQSGNNAFKVSSYYHTDWFEPEYSPLRFEGMSTDAVYENFVRQIAGDALSAASSTSGQSLKEAVAQSEKRQKLQKQIDALQKKVDNEKQFNKRMEMNAHLKAMRKEMEQLK